MKDRPTLEKLLDPADPTGDVNLERLREADLTGGHSPDNQTRILGVVVGTLVGFAESGSVPLVTYSERSGSAAHPARATLDLHAAHIGTAVVLMFEAGNPTRPIIVGRLRQGHTDAFAFGLEHLDIEADGRAITVSASDRVVLRCGKASITLTREGKIILQGEYVSSQSSGVLRLKGGSVQIN